MADPSAPSRRPRRRLLLLLTVILSGCTGTAPASPNAAPASALTPAPSTGAPAASVSAATQAASTTAATSTPTRPVATGTPLPPCPPGVICAGTLAAGTYTSKTLDLTLSIGLTGAGWVGGGDKRLEGFQISNPAAGGVNTVIFSTWDKAYSKDPCALGSILTTGTVADLIARVSATAGVTASAPGAATVAGWPATQLDISTASPCPDSRPISLWYMESGSPFTIATGVRARVYAFRIELPRSIGVIPLVKFPIVAIQASPQTNYDLLLQEAAKVIATLTIAL